MKSESAFSLIEVMVAILILAIAITGLTQGITTALGASKESELQTAAALLAAGQVELLRAQTDWTDGTEEGEGGAGLKRYHWRQTINASEIEGLHEVDVTVIDEPTGSTIYDLKTMLFQTPTDTASQRSPKGSRHHEP
jgi:prepilin-type N-terminal cleavage/methylation domain-containing protein